MSCLHDTVTSPGVRRGMALSTLDEQAETLQAFRCVCAFSPSIDASFGHWRFIPTPTLKGRGLLRLLKQGLKVVDEPTTHVVGSRHRKSRERNSQGGRQQAACKKQGIRSQN